MHFTCIKYSPYIMLLKHKELLSSHGGFVERKISHSVNVTPVRTIGNIRLVNFDQFGGLTFVLKFLMLIISDV